MSALSGSVGFGLRGVRAEVDASPRAVADARAVRAAFGAGDGACAGGSLRHGAGLYRGPRRASAFRAAADATVSTGTSSLSGCGTAR